MSKLEDKLSASIQPAKGKTAPAGKTARVSKPSQASRPGPSAKDAVEAAPPRPAGEEEASRPLHPRRVWPD